MSFYIGQRVVCVDDSPGIYPHSLKAGRCYTIIAVDLPGVFVKEEWHMNPSGFRVDRFRNIDDLTASLARTESERIVEERPDHVSVPQTVEP